jgi:hypothetical protein
MARRWLVSFDIMVQPPFQARPYAARRGVSRFAALFAVWCSAAAVPTFAAERLCDSAFEDCRAPLLQLIRAEQTGIDVAFWFMEDARYATELVNKARQGVPVRVLVDPRANAEHPVNAQLLTQLAAAGIPMRQRITSGILHWKMMLFAGQRTVQKNGILLS